jgi:hypothetical protein
MAELEPKREWAPPMVLLLAADEPPMPDVLLEFAPDLLLELLPELDLVSSCADA